MNTEKFLKVSIIFLLGFLSANIISFYLINGLETPFLYLGITNDSNKAPHDYINEDQIEIFDDKIIINIPNASISRYAPTGSMKPLLDQGANGIRIKPNSEEDIQVGDIISFRENNYLIVHRVIDKGIDEEGTYYITKGDNNTVPDGKVRFKDVEYVTVAIIW